MYVLFLKITVFCLQLNCSQSDYPLGVLPSCVIKGAIQVFYIVTHMLINNNNDNDNVVF